MIQRYGAGLIFRQPAFIFFCCTIALSYSLRYIIRSFAEASSTSGCEVSDGCPSSDQSLVKDEIRSRDLCSGKHLGFAYSLLFTLFLPATRESPTGPTDWITKSEPKQGGIETLYTERIQWQSMQKKSPR